MTFSPFYYLQPIDPIALRDAIAGCFCVVAEDVCVWDNTSDIDPPYEWDGIGPPEESKPAGRLYDQHEAADVRVMLDCDPPTQKEPGWFSIETKLHGWTFEDRPVAAAVAASLGQSIIFRDPVPFVHDTQLEGAQIGVDPSGVETSLWMGWDDDDSGETVTKFWRRDGIFRDTPPTWVEWP